MKHDEDTTKPMAVDVSLHPTHPTRRAQRLINAYLSRHPARHRLLEASPTEVLAEARRLIIAGETGL